MKTRGWLVEYSFRNASTISNGRVGGGGGARSLQQLLRSAVHLAGLRLRLRARQKMTGRTQNKIFKTPGKMFHGKNSHGARALPDLSLFGTLPAGEPDWFTGSLLSFGVTAGREVGVGTSAWGELSRTVKSAGREKKTKNNQQCQFFRFLPMKWMLTAVRLTLRKRRRPALHRGHRIFILSLLRCGSCKKIFEKTYTLTYRETVYPIILTFKQGGRESLQLLWTMAVQPGKAESQFPL